MSRKAVAIMSTDWHINGNNTEEVKDLIDQQIELGKKLNCNNHICLGDVFNSRQAQPLIVFKTLESILLKFSDNELLLTLFPGNHDKVNYNSYDSYLDPFSNYVFCNLYQKYDYLDVNTEDIVARYHFIPFFNEHVWLEEFEKVQIAEDKDNYLFSHIAVEGSINNDGTKVESHIKPSLFKDFNKVFLGHYHDTHLVGNNVYHLPSIQQNNFGENTDKGFIVLYDDGSHELIQSDFKQYHSIKINLNNSSQEEIKEYIKESSELIKEDGYKIKFKITGSEDKVRSFKKEDCEILGIKVEKNHKSVEQSIEKAESGEVVVYNNATISSKFDDFCKEEDYDNIDYGKECLNKKLEENG